MRIDLKKAIGAIGFLSLCLALLAAAPAWAKKDKWGEVKPAAPAPVTSYHELHGRIVLPLIGAQVLEKGRFAGDWTARLTDTSGGIDLTTKVTATGSFTFSGVTLNGPFEITVTDPQKRPLGLAVRREQFVADQSVTLDERSSVVVAVLQAFARRQEPLPALAEFEKPAHEKRMAALVQAFGEAVKGGAGTSDAAFTTAIDAFVTAFLTPPEPVIATPTAKTGSDTGTTAGEPGLRPVDVTPAGTGATTGTTATNGTASQGGASTGAGTSTGAAADQPPAATTVKLSQQVSYLKTVATQIRLTGNIGDWNGTVQLPTMKGDSVTFSRSNALSSEGKVVLLYKGLNIANLDHFTQLGFSEPVPSGTSVEVYDLDNDRSVATGDVP